MIETILASLIRANLAAGAAILVVLAIRKLVRPRFGARAAYALWLAPLAAGLAALPPHTVTPSLITPVVQSAVVSADEFVAAAGPAASGPDVASLTLAIWLAGLAAAVLLVGWRQGRFLRAMGRLEPGAEPGVFRAQNTGVGPAVVGTLRARIVTPADFETRFKADERALILAHERAHLAGGDAGANALACAAQCLCWFNPLVHLGARLARIDQELACDAAVVGRFPDARRAYGELLLKTQLFTQALPLGCHWPAPAEHPLKERIAMLKSPPPARAMRVMGLVVAVSLGLGAGGLAWAAQIGPGVAERLQAQRDFATDPGILCKPNPDRTLGPCSTPKAPNWLAVPTQADLMRYYPPAALKAGVKGRVQLYCQVQPLGRLTDCAVLGLKTELNGQPADVQWGVFEQAALQVSRYYQATPHVSAGRPPAMQMLQVTFSPTAATDPKPVPQPKDQVRAPPPPLALVTHPEWIEKPVPADIARVYPAQAAKDGLSGAATLDCMFRPNGRLQACKVIHEEPAQAGFGAAALKLSTIFQARPMSPDGDIVGGGTVRIPIRFMPATEPVPPQAAATPAIRQPTWIQMPTATELARFYPPEAVKRNFEGTSSLVCAVEKDGRLSGCVAEGVATFGVPADIREDFRKATLELAGFFRMQPKTVGGEPVAGGRVVIPIRWSLPNDPEAVARLAALKG